MKCRAFSRRVVSARVVSGCRVTLPRAKSTPRASTAMAARLSPDEGRAAIAVDARGVDFARGRVTLHPETTRADTTRLEKARHFIEIFRDLPAKVASRLVFGKSRDSISSPAGIAAYAAANRSPAQFFHQARQRASARYDTLDSPGRFRVSRSRSG